MQRYVQATEPVPTWFRHRGLCEKPLSQNTFEALSSLRLTTDETH